jgi:nucleotide-binding universal stress UspA family protein
MPAIERILCPTDSSEFSATAYNYALSLARHYQSRLSLQYVLDFTLSGFAYLVDPIYIKDLFQQVRHEACLQLESFAKRPPRDGAEPQRVFCQGAAAKSILAFAEAQGTNLIVMGSHGLKAGDGVAIGPVAEKVVRHAACSVLVVGRSAHGFANGRSAQDPIRISKLLACTDFSTCSMRALEHAISLAAEYEAELTVLYVLEEMPASGQWGNGIRQLVKRIEESIYPELRGSSRVRPVVRTGEPYREIIQQATEQQSDAVIMGVPGRNALDLAIFGSTTDRVIQFSPCPVLAAHT